jgi:hypothetical protein
MKPIPNFPGYLVDQLGNVYSLLPRGPHCKPPSLPKRKKKRTVHRKANDYYIVTLLRDGKRITRTVSSLALETFVGPRPTGMYACHGPKGSLNDSLGNLYWATPRQNALDKYRDGTMPIGECSPNAKLTSEQVSRIRNEYRHGIRGFGQRSLAARYGVAHCTIRRIVSRRWWKHLP